MNAHIENEKRCNSWTVKQEVYSFEHLNTTHEPRGTIFAFVSRLLVVNGDVLLITEPLRTIDTK